MLLNGGRRWSKPPERFGRQQSLLQWKVLENQEAGRPERPNALQFLRHLLVGGNDGIESIGNLAGQSDPGTGKAGDEITVAGENLEKAQVAKVYLTDGKNDIRC